MTKEEQSLFNDRAERLSGYRDEVADLRAKLAEAERARSTKMFVWTDQVSYLAVAQAESVTGAREQLALEMGVGDGSCPIRAKAEEYIRGAAPTMWRGRNAEFILTDSGHQQALESDLQALRLRLSAAEKLAAENAEKAGLLDWLLSEGFANADTSYGGFGNEHYVQYRCSFVVPEPSNWPGFDEEEWTKDKLLAALQAARENHA